MILFDNIFHIANNRLDMACVSVRELLRSRDNVNVHLASKNGAQRIQLQSVMSGDGAL